MKKFILFFLASFFITILSAQELSIEKLKESAQAADNQEKVDLLNELSSRLTNSGIL